MERELFYYVTFSEPIPIPSKVYAYNPNTHKRELHDCTMRQSSLTTSSKDFAVSVVIANGGLFERGIVYEESLRGRMMVGTLSADGKVELMD